MSALGAGAHSYDYSALPLDTTASTALRLVSFDRHDDGTIHTSLEMRHVDDPECPPWIALSYTWDSYSRHEGSISQIWVDDKEHSIMVNGVRFSVRLNLWRAINALLDQKAHAQIDDDTAPLAPAAHETDDSFSYSGSLSPARWQYFWIDAICINQNDPAERNHQVGLMKMIFSKAICVIGWLAPEKFDRGPDGLRCAVSSLKKYADNLVGETGPSNSDYHRNFDELRSLFDNAYWSRMWIVQEIILAREVLFLYGSLWLPTSLLCPQGPLAQQNPASLISDRHRYRKIEDKPWSFTLYFTYGARACSDRRDRIYGLLGILPQNYQLQPDYTITREDLFFRVLHAERHRHSSSHDGYLFDLADRLMQLLDLSKSITRLIKLATCFYYEQQRRRGKIVQLACLSESMISHWLTTTNDGHKFLRGKVKRSDVGWNYLRWSREDLEQLDQVHPYPKTILMSPPGKLVDAVRTKLGGSPASLKAPKEEDNY